MSNSIAPGSLADVNIKVTALTTNPNVPVTYKTIILKKNFVNGVNTLTQEMMSATNTKYVVKYDYVLGEDIIEPLQIDTTNSFTWATYFTYYYKAINVEAGKAITLLDDALCFSSTSAIESGRTKFIETATTIYIATKEPDNYNNAYRISDYITVPDNCVLKFEGGSLIGGAINGNPLIDADATTIFNNCIVDYKVNNLYINIKWFGAEGNGVTDDTIAIKRAVLGKNGITVYFPKGKYVISDNINVCKTYQYWKGESSNGQDHADNVYINDCEFWCVGDIDKPYLNAPRLMENISFLRRGSIGGTGLMLSVPYVWDFPTIKNVNIIGFDKGLHLESCGAKILDCKIWDNNIGIYSMQRYAGGQEHGYTTSVLFDRCWVSYNKKYAFYKDFYSNSEKKAPQVSVTTFRDCTIEFNAMDEENTHGEISHITYDEIISPAPTLGRMFFENCYSESEHTFINAERGEFHFHSCMMNTTNMIVSKYDVKTTGIKSLLSFNNSDFSKLIVTKGGNSGLNANLPITIINSNIKEIKIDTSYASTNKALSPFVNKTFITKTPLISNIDLTDNLSGEEYFTMDYGIPVYTFKVSNGDGTTGMEILDALGNRVTDKKVSDYSTRTYTPLNIGFLLYATNFKKPYWWDGSVYRDANGIKPDVRINGLFDQKPNASDIYQGYCYYCTDRKINPVDFSIITSDAGGMPIYFKGLYNSDQPIWVDALGRVVS